MLRSTALAVVAAAAVSAQSPNLVVRQVDEVGITDIQAHLSGVAFNATMDATSQMFTTMSTAAAANQAASDQMQSQITAAMNDMDTQLATQSTAYSSAIAANAAQLSTTIAQLSNSVSSQLSSAAAARNGAISTAEAALISRSAAAAGETTVAVRAMNSTLIASLASKASTQKHMWLGGCTNHNHGCWQDFCLNRVELDKARPYFYKRTNTRMRALRSGMFRMQAYFMGTRNYMHVSVFINGRRKRNTHYRTRYGWWKGDFSDHTTYITQNQDFWFQGCGHFHNAGGEYHYQRQEFFYVGQRPS